MLHLITLLIVILLCLIGILIVPLSLPGTWVIVLAGIGYSLFYSFQPATSPFAVGGILLSLAIFGEIVEFVVGTFGSKPLKVSNGAILSAFIGGILGAIVGVPVFLIGSLLGIFIGAFLGAFLYEWVTLKKLGRAFINACAVLATKVVASVLKTSLAIGMTVYLLVKIF